MPEVKITIGARPFRVTCQEGEEHFLHAAAAMLDTEANSLRAQLGDLPESRMLLMAGLMLADRTAAVEDELRGVKARLAEAEGRVPAPVEVAVVPPGLVDAMAELAARAEAMAAEVEERVA
jgi:cell division protein ZapA